MPMISSGQAVLSVVLLSGCAAAQSNTASGPEPDCSFRSSTTCWTLAGRFPPRRLVPATRKPDDIRDPSPAVLATTADSARGSR